MTDIKLQKAVMIPVQDQTLDFGKAIAVQFNPESLKVTLTNTLKTGNAGGDQGNAAQFVDKSESSLSVQLIFDTSIGRPEDTISFDAPTKQDAPADQDDSQLRGREVKAKAHAANSDVRKLTKAIVDQFMAPGQTTADGVKAPKKCRFQWGTFAFVGMMSSYEETLDFFAPEGIPLRATLSLSFKEDRFQFEDPSDNAAARENPTFAPGGDNVPIAKAAKNAGTKPKDWRNLALFNGIETPRFAGPSGLSVPGVNVMRGLSTSSGPAGLSHALGGGLPGAFAEANGLAGTASRSISRAAANVESAGRFTSAAAMAADGIVSTTGAVAAEADDLVANATADFDNDTA